MDFLIKYILVFAMALVAALLLVPVAKRVAPRWGLVDIPSERRIHKTPIPRCGGLAVFAATHLALLIVFFGPWKNLGGSVQVREWLIILPASLVLLLIGLWDDRSGMKAWVKLLGQLGVAAFMFFCGFSFESLLGFHVPAIINFGATLFWFALLINAFNLSDGMDGACAGLGVVSATALAVMLFFVHQPTDALIMVALVGACLGFLRYNFNPASVFLGDCGSMFIGFMLAAVSLKAKVNQSLLVSLLIPLLAVGVPVFDVILAVWRRMGRRLLSKLQNDSLAYKIFGPDLDHIHHKLLKKGFSQRKAALLLYLGSSVVCLLAIGHVFLTDYRQAFLLVALVVVVLGSIRQVAHLELWTTTLLLLKGVRRPRSVLRLGLHMGADLLVLTAVTAGIWLFLGYRLEQWFWMSILIWAPLAAILFAQAYQSLWSRAWVGQYLKLSLMLIVGDVIAFFVLLMTTDLSYRVLVPLVLIHCAFSQMGIIGGRMLPTVLRDLSTWLGKELARDRVERTLILGGDKGAHNFLRQLFNGVHEKVHRKVIGIIDENPEVHGKVVFAYPVLGAFCDVEACIQTHQITELLVVPAVLRNEQEALFALQKQYGLKVREFRSGLYDIKEDGECTGMVWPEVGKCSASLCKIGCIHE